MSIPHKFNRIIQDRIKESSFIALILIASFIVRIPFLRVPLDSNSGAFVAIGRLVSKGAVLYKDIFEIKPPGIYLVFSLLSKFKELELFDVNLFMACWGVLNTFLVYILAKKLFDKRTACLSALLFGIFSSSPFVGGVQVSIETFMVTCMVLGVIVLIGAINSRRNYLFFISGLICGLGFLFKQTTFFDCLTILVFLCILHFWSAEKSNVLSFKSIFLYLFGYLIPICFVFVYVVMLGIWKDFFFAVFTFGGKFVKLAYSKEYPYWLKFAYYNSGILRSISLLWICSFVFIIAAILMSASKRYNKPISAQAQKSSLLLVIWAILLFLSVSLSGRFASYYYLILLPPFSIMTAVVLDKVILLYRSLRRRPVAIIAGILVLFSIGYSFLLYYKNYFVYTPQEISINMYNRDALSEIGQPAFVEAEEIGMYLRNHTGPQDYIYNWSTEPEIFFYARRNSASRYLWISFYTAYFGVIPDIVNEICGELKKNRAAYVIMDARYLHYLKADVFKPLYDFIYANYAFEKDFKVIRDGKLVSVIWLCRLKKG